MNIDKLNTKQKLSFLYDNLGEVLSTQEVASTLSISIDLSSKLLARWNTNGWVQKIKRGLFIILPIEVDKSTQTIEDPFTVVPSLFGNNAYIGGWSAAEYWNLTEQIFNDLSVLTDKKIKQKKVTFNHTNFILTQVSASKIYGNKTIWRNSTKVNVSDPTKTIIDMFASPSLAPGIDHLFKCYKNYLHSEHYNYGLLVDYAIKYGNKAIFKRLGYLSSLLLNKDDNIINLCKSHLSPGYAQLDPAHKGKKLITNWYVFIPNMLKIDKE